MKDTIIKKIQNEFPFLTINDIRAEIKKDPLVTEGTMFIHIGDNIIVSDKKLVGIFNRETLELSNDNEWILKQVDSGEKTIALDRYNTIMSSSCEPLYGY